MKDKKTDIFKDGTQLRDNPFSVPEGYFENLSSRIRNKIDMEEQESPVRIRSHWYTVRSQLALAASIIGFALISFIAIKLILPNQTLQNDYIDISLFEEMNILPDDSYLVDLYSLEEDDYSEDTWINEAEDYLASSDIEIDLVIDIY